MHVSKVCIIACEEAHGWTTGSRDLEIKNGVRGQHAVGSRPLEKSRPGATHPEAEPRAPAAQTPGTAPRVPRTSYCHSAFISRNPLHAEYVWHENPHWHYFTLQYDSGGGHTSLLTRSGLFESQGSELQVSSRARWRLCEELIGRVVS